ncbi:MAG: MarP family serine protease [Candidatus Nanopelagicales bacterium]
MTIVDWVLVGAVIAFAWAGWRQGFVVGLLSFAGFLGGGLAAAYFLPEVIASFMGEGLGRALLLVGAVLCAALLGQVLASILGRTLRAAITWSPAKYVDKTAGAGLNVLALAVIIWILASAIAMLPTTQATLLIQQSKVVSTLDLLVPNQVRDVFIHLRDAVGQSSLPRVFSTISEVVGPEVDAPDSGIVESAPIQRAADSVARIFGTASACKVTLTGTGFFVGSGIVLTNAHVVAGVDSPDVEIGGIHLPASVVYFDPRVDIAALRVDSAPIAPLSLQTAAPLSGSDAAIAGYPGGRALEVTAVRIRALIDARGDDIYGRSGVARRVVSFRGNVERGDSGGPLLSMSGEVTGMVFGAGITSNSTGYAIASSELQSAIDAAKSSAASVSTGSCVVRE